MPSNVANMHFNMEKIEYEQSNFCHYNQYSGLKIAKLSTAYEKFELASAEGKPREARAPRQREFGFRLTLASPADVFCNPSARKPCESKQE